MTLIAIDAGHGPQTPGKRTPMFPDGGFMHENEFNRAVAELLITQLACCGFDTLRVFQYGVDTPLEVRTRMANAAGADFYISIHANADGCEWSSANGIETFHYIHATQENMYAAGIIQKHLIEGTPHRDRGVKAADFHVLRETRMPSVLVECGFMSNLVEARQLLTAEYRLECATELAEAICEIFGREYMTEEEVAEMNKQLESMEAQLIAMAEKVVELENKTKALDKTAAPDWFISEFGQDEITAYLNEAIGDVDFWRNFAVMLRVFLKKNL